MDLTALVIALVAASIIFSGFFLTRNIESKFVSITLRIVVGISGFMAISIISMLLKLPTEVSTNAGTYFLYVMILGCLVSSVLNKKTV